MPHVAQANGPASPAASSSGQSDISEFQPPTNIDATSTPLRSSTAESAENVEGEMGAVLQEAGLEKAEFIKAEREELINREARIMKAEEDVERDIADLQLEESEGVGEDNNNEVTKRKVEGKLIWEEVDSKVKMNGEVIKGKQNERKKVELEIEIPQVEEVDSSEEFESDEFSDEYDESSGFHAVEMIY